MGTKLGSVRVVGCRAAVAVVTLLLVLVLVLSGCGPVEPAPVYGGYGPAPAGYYRIRSGDTLYKIAGRYRVDYKTLARWNQLDASSPIYAGSLLRVELPRGISTGRSGRGKARTATRTRAQGTTTPKNPTRVARRTTNRGTWAASGLRWRWPLRGKVVQGFRPGDRTRQGIRIAGRPGQKVLAAEGGIVVYSDGGLKGYGNLVIVKHNGNYLSAYGFNRRLLVSEGVRVRRGQGIAEVGQASDGAYRLHFEVRRNGAPVDPLKYLP